MKTLRRSAIAASVCTAACGALDDPGPSVVRSDSAGVEIVTSVVDDRSLGWSLERLYARGGAEEGPESFYWVGTGTVDADGDGRVYVLDPSQARVVVFDAEGAFLRALGGRGEGPGELSSPNSLAVSPGGVVSVFDFGKGGLVRFDSAGLVLAEMPFPAYPWPDAGRHMGVSDEGVVAASMLRSPPEGHFQHGLRWYVGADTVPLVDHVFPQPGMVRYTSCGGGLNLPRVFEAHVTWDNHGAMVAAAAGPAYALTVFETGSPVRRIRVDREPRTATEAMAEEHLGEGFRINFGSGPCTIPPTEMVPLRGFAEVLPWIDEVAVSPTGEIWARRFVVGPDAEGPIDVFDVTGAYVGTAPPDTPFPLAFLDADRFASMEIDEADVRRVVVYRIVRGVGG